MKKTSFLTGMLFGVTICLAVALMVGYLVFEGLEKRRQPAPAAKETAQTNFTPAPMPKTPAEMLVFLDNIIKTRPQEAARAYAAKGDILTELGDWAGAIKNYDMALRREPSNPDLYFARSVAKFMAGDVGGAAQDLSIAIQLNPQMAQAYFNRGVANVNLSQFPQAEADFTQARDFFALNKDARNFNDSARALKAVQDYRLASAAVPAAQKRGQGQAPAAAPAAKNPKELVSIKRDDESAQRNKSSLVSSLSGMGKEGGVLEKFRANAAVNRQGDMPGLGELDNYDAAARRAMAESREKQSQAPKTFLDYKSDAQKKMAAGDFAGAVSDLDKALALNPDAEHLLMDRANANIQAGNAKDALGDIDKILSINPDNASAWLKKAQLESSLGNNKAALSAAQTAKNLFSQQGNTQGAIDAENEENRQLNRARIGKKGDNSMQKLFTEATKAYEKGDYKAARAAFENMAKLSPKDAGNYYNIGLTYLQEGKYDLALEQFKIADKLNPNDPKTKQALASTSAQLGQTKEAKNYNDQAGNLTGDNAQNLTNRAFIEAREGNIDKALGTALNADRMERTAASSELLGSLYLQKLPITKEGNLDLNADNIGVAINNLEKSLSHFDNALELLRADGNEKAVKEITEKKNKVKELLEELKKYDGQGQ